MKDHSERKQVGFIGGAGEEGSIEHRMNQESQQPQVERGAVKMLADFMSPPLDNGRQPDTDSGEENTVPASLLKRVGQEVYEDNTAHGNEYEPVESGERLGTTPAQPVDHGNRSEYHHAEKKVEKL